MAIGEELGITIILPGGNIKPCGCTAVNNADVAVLENGKTVVLVCLTCKAKRSPVDGPKKHSGPVYVSFDVEIDRYNAELERISRELSETARKIIDERIREIWNRLNQE